MVRFFRSRQKIWAISNHFLTDPYAVPGATAAMLFFSTASLSSVVVGGTIIHIAFGQEQRK
jgi:hypothetical protein